MGAARRLPGDPRRPAARARPRAISIATRWPCSSGSSREDTLTANAVVGFWPANTVDATTSWSGATRTGATRLATFRTLRQQMAKPDGPAEHRARRLRRPGRDRRARLRRRVRGHRGPRPRRARRRVRGRQRRLLRDPRQGPRGPPGRGVRRAAARARAARALGLRARRGSRRTPTSSPSGTRASGRRPAIRPARTTPRRARSSISSRPSHGPGSA